VKPVFREKVYRRNAIIYIRTILLIGIPLMAFLWAEANLRPVLLTMAEARARVMAVRAMNDAVFELIGDAEPYDGLMSIAMDGAGRVSMMQANTARMNELSANAAQLVQRNLDALVPKGIPVPLGAALGPRLLAGIGPSVTVRASSVGAVSTEFVSEFTSAGINQTRHRIFLTITSSIRLVIPTGAKVITVYAQMPVAESIIVGEVPKSFIEIAGAASGVLP